MRIKKTKVYKFDELSDDAKETAIEKHREFECNAGYTWAEEGINTLKEFGKQFDINIKDWALDYCVSQSHIFFDADNYDMQADCVVGVRVFKYLQNRYAVAIKSFQDCAATGYCFDCTIIKPIVKFMKHPNKTTTLTDLYSNCFDAFIDAWVADYNYQMSAEAIIETIEANEYEFTEDGKIA